MADGSGFVGGLRLFFSDFALGLDLGGDGGGERDDYARDELHTQGGEYRHRPSVRLDEPNRGCNTRGKQDGRLEWLIVLFLNYLILISNLRCFKYLPLFHSAKLAIFIHIVTTMFLH